MISITDKHNCCGCAACVQACPKHCISLSEDDEGFLYPYADSSVCIDCGLCEKVCPVLNQASADEQPLKVLACKNKDEEIRRNSSSGGVFTLLAENVIRAGGIVFGAEYDDNWEVKHGYTYTIEGLTRLRTSKYVQSRMEDNYIEAKAFLRQGRLVMFVGTSCQIAGLRNYLRHDYDNLLTVDVICHGTPSPKVWRSYLEYIKARKGFAGKNTVFSSLKSVPVITGINFRDKCVGWKKFSFSVTLAEASADGDKNSVFLSHILSEDTYMRSFLSNLNLRPSCYHCPAKGGKSHSDITLADYWGIWNQHPEFDDDKGIGLTIVHTQKGLKALDMAKMETIEVTMEEGTMSNPSYYNPVAEPPKRNLFFKRFNNGDDFDTIVDDLLRIPLSVKVKCFIKRHIKKIIKSS